MWGGQHSATHKITAKLQNLTQIHADLHSFFACNRKKKHEKCIGNLLLSDKNQNEYKKGPQSLNLCDGDFFFFNLQAP